ncbi:D-alanyl-D-alanine carboxypeptidase [Streptomyces sp. NBC_01775]|uniref:D-alanyl-D-alanine carboxypeptidase n=1 Tax=Streptomyces sp. NBC_01775 TaxID=2975939 RepID=UPI002DD8309A|nr:D-alanyl-D-alanine carboxypeptidase [Streptomyces sp. NBC_01775]WSB78533.1 D-alanyl-D-alanine carboxypeptidase [Streptomyces sp. NBC_01775]
MASGEQQHQEALVAGESPDRSEREKSSGETTESGGKVARPDGTAENERLNGDESSKVPSPASPAGEQETSGSGERAGSGDEGDARLKSAVAAWVAGDPAEEDGADADPKGSGEGDEEAEGADVPGQKPGKAAAQASGGDAPTAMFGIVRPGDEPDSTDSTDSRGGTGGTDSDRAAAERAERLTSAFFGSSKSAKDEADMNDDGRKGEGSGSDEDAGSGGSAAKGKGAPAVDQPTAVFRTSSVPSAAPQGEKSGTPEGSEKSGTSGGKGSATSAAAGAASSAAAGAKGAQGATSAEAAKRDPRLGGTGTGEAARSDQPGGSTKSGNRAGAEESEAERTSQFVPLKSTDGPRTPAKPLPPAVPAGAAAPSAPPAPAKPPAAPKAGADSGTTAPQAPPATPSKPSWASAPPPPPGAPGTAAESGPERTRQQPMPDVPPEGGPAQPQQSAQPLDLLAQLTNTPPPPATPLRTLTRRVKIWTPLVLLLAVIFVVAQAVRPLPGPELSLTAADSYAFTGSKPSVPWPSEGQAVLEVDGLGSLGSYGKQKPTPIASVAKVMTAYVILRDHPFKKGSKGANIPVDQKAEDQAALSAQNESTVEVKAGKKISQREALDALMIASANNVARLLGRWDAGSEKAFVKKMNAAAKDIGMTNSRYTDPSGLTSSTVSTAADQVKLAKKVMEFPVFREIVRQPSYVDGNGKTQPNWNRLVPVDGVVGIKTGTTTKAGGNLVFAAEKEIGGTKQLIIGAMLGQYQPSILDTVLNNSKKLIDSAQDALRARKVVKKGAVVGYVDDQMGGKASVVATKDVTAVGWSGLKVKLGLTDKGKSIPHEAKRGTKVGTMTVGDGPGQVKVPVALQDDLTEPGFGSKLTRVG